MDVDAVVRLIAAIGLVLLAGCADRYRYPCQDPEMWDQDICKKPNCEVNRSCPEHIFKDEQPCKIK